MLCLFVNLVSKVWFEKCSNIFLLLRVRRAEQEQSMRRTVVGQTETVDWISAQSPLIQLRAMMCAVFANGNDLSSCH